MVEKNPANLAHIAVGEEGYNDAIEYFTLIIYHAVCIALALSLPIM